MKLTIIRGISGSGKTTIAEELVRSGKAKSYVEADQYFVNPTTGEYEFDRGLLPRAHAWCKARVEDFLKHGESVVVSNTFTKKWEYEPYLKLAEQYGAEVEIIVATGNYQNVHGVPSEVVEARKARWEE